MSRVGKQPITIPESVKVDILDGIITVTGAQGTLTQKIPFGIEVSINEGIVTVTRKSDAKPTRALHGAIRAHINNMINGVQTPYKKELEIRGTGYKASISGNKLTVLAGYIHPVHVEVPEGITIQVPDETHIVITGANKYLVGQLASNIRKIRKPEPYKGKGIRYVDEVIKLKAGKTAKA
jgi:large subunit ribosomal protein L6